ncbi:MAG TPA: universal stress protein [Asanoa sp.]|jgi:nucleotide-binding universal stress UspA family protein
MRSGPVVIGFDGTIAAQRALRESAALLAPRPALVVVVWEAGRAFEIATLPNRALEMPPVSVDVRAALDAEEVAYEAAERLAQQGAALASELGYQAEGLAVADDMTVADTLVRVATERDSPALVVGSHGRRGLTSALLGSTSNGVVDKAPCPVVVVRTDPRRKNRDGR